MGLESNFSAWLTDEGGLLVPGSVRTGHNVFTEVGRLWVSRLVAWTTVGVTTDDVPGDERRPRWLGVGSGSQLEQRGAERLVAPLTITTAPDAYLRAVAAPAFPVIFSQRYTVAFTGASADFDHHGASVSVSEAGLYVDVDDGGGPLLDPGVGTNQLAFYKSFAALTKLAAQTLTVTWELRY